jgi:selenocysteine lyase/cysteine desulfurase
MRHRDLYDRWLVSTGDPPQTAEQKMNVSISSAASTRLDMDQRGLSRVIRASVHYYNTEEEIERFYDSVSDFVRRNS